MSRVGVLAVSASWWIFQPNASTSYLFQHHGNEHGVSGGCTDVTSNHVELLAVVMALRNMPAESPLHIRTDSRYVLDTFNSFAPSDRIFRYARVRGVRRAKLHMCGLR